MQLFFVNLQNTRIIYPNWEHRVMRKVIQKLIQTKDMQEELSFGAWLRKQRRALDLTRQAFADQIGCAEVTLRRIEAGTLKPSKELASILLEKLGIPESQRPQLLSFARGLSSLPDSSLPLPNKPKSNLPAPLTS